MIGREGAANHSTRLGDGFRRGLPCQWTGGAAADQRGTRSEGGDQKGRSSQDTWATFPANFSRPQQRSKVATPGRIGAQTPATSRAGSRTPAPQTARKRDAPTPTPSATAGTKRAKTTAGSMTSSTSLSLSTSSNGAPLRSPAPVCGLPRPVVVAGSSAGRSISLQDVLGNSTAQNRAAQARSWSNGLVDKREGASKLGLAAGRRPARRDSFRPRPSVGGLAMTGGTGRERDEILAEEQDVF